MKKILILADGSLARHFINQIKEIKYIKTHFSVVSYDEMGIEADNMDFFIFDPTHPKRLEDLLFKNDFLSVYIILDDNDTLLAHKAIRQIRPKINIITCSNQIIQDEQTQNILKDSILGHRLVSSLQDTPTIAQNVGLGSGEIMQIQVPIGGHYAYKHVEVLNQKQAKIALIYRNNQIIIPKRGVMVYPNDILLLVGQPNILLNEFLKSKENLGQFPNPYGVNICVILNELNENTKNLIDSALLLHSKINSKKLTFNVLNPTINKDYFKLKKLLDGSITTNFFYDKTTIEDIIEDFGVNKGGIFVTNNDVFLKHKKAFFKSGMPVLKVGSGGFLQLRQGLILKDDFINVEDISIEFLDICKQLKFKPIVDCYLIDNPGVLYEHFSAISSSYDMDVKILQSRENPILKYKNSNRFLQFVPFYEELLKPNLEIKNQLNIHHAKLGGCYQMFIPV